MLEYFILQILSYHFILWITWILLAYFMARYVGIVGVFLGGLLISISIVWSDILWIRSEMAHPEWDGMPDMDIVFHIGVLLRIIIINAVLLPVYILGVYKLNKKN